MTLESTLHTLDSQIASALSVGWLTSTKGYVVRNKAYPPTEEFAGFLRTTQRVHGAPYFAIEGGAGTGHDLAHVVQAVAESRSTNVRAFAWDLQPEAQAAIQDTFLERGVSKHLEAVGSNYHAGIEALPDRSVDVAIFYSSTHYKNPEQKLAFLRMLHQKMKQEHSYVLLAEKTPEASWAVEHLRKTDTPGQFDLTKLAESDVPAGVDRYVLGFEDERALRWYPTTEQLAHIARLAGFRVVHRSHWIPEKYDRPNQVEKFSVLYLKPSYEQAGAP